MTRVAFLLLNYNSANETVKLAKSLVEIMSNNDKIIIIDNKSTDNSLTTLKPVVHDLQLELISAKFNGGYASGNNLGIKRAKELDAEFVFIMNTDIDLNNFQIQPVYEFMVTHPQCAIASPTLVNLNGEKKFGKKISFGKIEFQRELLLEGVQPQEVETIDGACYIVRMSAIDIVGSIPEPYFLNFEETEWCLRFQRANFKIYCLPASSVTHEEGSSIGQISGMQVYFLRRNLVLFNKRMGTKYDLIRLLVKLVPFSIIQSIRHFNLTPIRAYLDGLTGKNRYSRN